jgi:hypothetical protein
MWDISSSLTSAKQRINMKPTNSPEVELACSAALAPKSTQHT